DVMLGLIEFKLLAAPHGVVERLLGEGTAASLVGGAPGIVQIFFREVDVRLDVAARAIAFGNKPIVPLPILRDARAGELVVEIQLERLSGGRQRVIFATRIGGHVDESEALNIPADVDPESI